MHIFYLATVSDVQRWLEQETSEYVGIKKPSSVQREFSWDHDLEQLLSFCYYDVYHVETFQFSICKSDNFVLASISKIVPFI